MLIKSFPIMSSKDKNKAVYDFKDGYSIKVIQDLEEFDGLREVWDGMVEANESHVPFLCFDWFKIWLNHFLKDDQLFIVLLQKNGEPVAIAPFVIQSEFYKRVMRARKVSLIGNVHSPIRNFLFRYISQESRFDCLQRIVHFFAHEFKQWDVMELDSMPVENGTHNILRKAAREASLKAREYFCFGDWYLDGIDYTGEEYIRRLRKKTRNELTRRTRRLVELGNINFEIGTKNSEFDRHMNLYYQVREKSWKSPENDQAFLLQTRKMAAEKGWLRCGFLFLDSRPIAAQIRMISNKKAYFMESLYDAEFDKYGPGDILRSEMIKHFIDIDGIVQIDQVRGDESYKKYWTPKRRERKGITVFNRNWKGVFLAFMEIRCLPIIKKNRILSGARNFLSSRLGGQ